MTAAGVGLPARARVASPLRHRVRGRVLLTLCVLYAILYFDRVNIATAGPNGLVAELGLSKVEFGLATSAFALPYALLQSFGGLVGDRFGARRVLAAAALLCGLFTAATGLVGGLAALLLVRFGLGLAEGAAFPTATHAMAEWLPPDRRGFGQGAVHAASRLSNAGAPLVVAALITVPALRWRGSFVVAGVTGAVWAVIWWVWFRDRPRDHPAVRPVEAAEVARTIGDAPAGRTRPPTPWRRLLPRIAPVTATDFCYGWMLWVYLTWIPSFFADSYDLALASSAAFTALTLAGGVVGDWVGGALCDGLLRRTGRLAFSRKAGLVIGFTGSAALVTPVLFVHSLTAATILLALGFFFLELCNSPLWTIPMDIAPAHSGVASGLMNTGFGISGLVAAPVFGFLADRSGYPTALAVSAGLLVAGLVLTTRISVRELDPAG